MIFSDRIRCLLHCEGSACITAVKPLLLAPEINLRKKKVRKGSRRVLYRKQGSTEPIELNWERMSYSQIFSKAPWAWNQWGCNSPVSWVLKSLGAADDSTSQDKPSLVGFQTALLAWSTTHSSVLRGSCLHLQLCFEPFFLWSLWRKETCLPFLDLSAQKREMVICTEQHCLQQWETIFPFPGHSLHSKQ